MIHPSYPLLSITLKSKFYLVIWSKCPLCFQVAIKSIRKEKIKDEQDMVHIRREIEIMSSLRHPHIISIYEGEGLPHVWIHAHTWQIVHTLFNLNTHKHKHTCSKFTLLPQLTQHLWPSCRIVMLWHADVIIRPGLQLWDVIHLLCSVWLPGPVKVWMALTVCVWISLNVCVCVHTCVESLCV